MTCGVPIWAVALIGVGATVWITNHEALITSQDGGAAPPHWAVLTVAEKVTFKDAIKSLPPTTVAIFCNELSCGDLSRSIEDVFKSLKWKTYCCASAFVFPDPGVRVWIKSDALRAVPVALQSVFSGNAVVGDLPTSPITSDAADAVIQIGHPDSKKPGR